jgi:TonB-linked SusC/RagA family outer membrane protein
MITMKSARAIGGALVGVLFALPGASAQAQNAVITGRVTSEFNQPIEAANVIITELSISVGTNAQGNYTITIPAARVSGQAVTLRVRAIGYEPGATPIHVTAGAQSHNFALKQDINRLNEVVVTGTVGEGVERSKVPFAVGRLTEADIPVPALDPVTALEGKVAGLRIAQTSGQPGSTPQIQLRGPTSINTNGRSTAPLFVVDGVIMNVGSLTELGGLDIESVEVVKGAAGASVYGTRAANGVIEVKTKRGATGSDGIRFNLRSEYGISDLNSIDYGMPINHQLVLDESGQMFCVAGASNQAPCSRTVSWMKEILRINNVAADTTRTPVSLQGNSPSRSNVELQNAFLSNPWPGGYYNPLAQVLLRNPVTLNAVDATGKLGSVRFYVSGSTQDETGAIRGLTGNRQQRARVNLDYDARRDLTFSVSTLYDNGHNDNRSGGSTGGSIFGQVERGTAIGTNELARDTLGRPLVLIGGSNLISPLGNGSGALLYDMENLVNFTTSSRFVGNITSRYFPLDWLTIDGTYAYDNRSAIQKSYELKDYRTFTTSSADNNGQLQFRNGSNVAMNGNLGATIRKQLRSDLNATFQVRGNFDQQRQIADSSGGQVFNVSGVFTTSNVTTNITAKSGEQTIKNEGFLAGTSLDFKDRYIVDGAFRYDGSSLFGSGNRWAPFGRISGVWRVSEEPFYHLNFLTDFRIRASHGTAGSTPSFIAQYETYNCTTTGCSLGQAGNTQLKPETTTENEFGTDFTLLNRLGVELTNARSVTKNQILQVQTPAALGFTSQWQNAGTLSNNTYEVGLNLPVLNRKDFSWTMHGTWDRTRTFITELFTPEFFTDGGTAQGSATFFLVSARTDKSNGFQINRFGQIWGRKFYKKCSDMPGSLQGSCGDGKEYQVNDRGYVVWVGAGNSWKDGITKNLWQTYLPGALSPFGNKVPLFFGMPIVDRPLRGQPNEGFGINQILGNVFPDFRFSYSNSVTYKRLTLYGLLDATIGQSVYNQPEQWGLSDLSSANFDMASATVATAKPLGYQWRGGPSESTGIGGLYDILNPNNYNIEDASFAKIREISLTYHVGPVRSVGDWTVGLIGRNLFTFTHYTGLDPEVGASGGSGTTSALVNGTDAFGFPTLRTYTVSLTTRF